MRSGSEAGSYPRLIGFCFIHFLPQVVAVRAGRMHSVVLTAPGGLFCFGFHPTPPPRTRSEKGRQDETSVGPWLLDNSPGFTQAQGGSSASGFTPPHPPHPKPKTRVSLLLREGERDTRLRAPRATRPRTVGYVGGGDQEQGQIEYL